MMIGIIVLIAIVNPYFLIPTASFLLVLVFIRKFYLPTGRSLKRLDASSKSYFISQQKYRIIEKKTYKYTKLSYTKFFGINL